MKELAFVLLFVFGAFPLNFYFGHVITKADIIKQCKEKGRIIYSNETILDCKVSNINDVLGKPYWERE